MRWKAVLIGQPPSLNDLYAIGYRYASDGRRYKGIQKNPAAQLYQDGAVLQIRTQRPARWKPPEKGLIRIRIWLFLSHDIDADNSLKVLCDAVEDALGINDNRFLPGIEWKWTVPAKDAQVVIEIDDDPSPSVLQGPEIFRDVLDRS